MQATKPGDQQKVVVLILAIILVIVVMAITVVPKLSKPAASAAAPAPRNAVAKAAPAPTSDFAVLHEVFERDETVATVDPFRRRGGKVAGTVNTAEAAEQRPPTNDGLVPPARPTQGEIGWEVIPDGGDPAPAPITSVTVMGAVYDPGSQSRSMAVIQAGDKVLSLKVGEDIVEGVTLHSVREAGIELMIQGQKVYVEVGKTYPPQASAQG